MGSKGGSTVIGYRYRIAYQMGLGIGPIDAFLEFRGGDKTAWAGQLTASGRININQPKLWGGDSDQGGIVGNLSVLFGEASQVPSAYLKSTFGPQVPAWRGLATVVFEGGIYGALNPYPQKASYKIRKTKAGWDDPGCWYPERCEVPILSGARVQTWTDFSSGFETNAPTMFAIVDGGAISNTTLNATNADYWRTALPASNVSGVYFEFKVLTAASGDPITMALTDAAGTHILDFNPRTEDRVDGFSRPAINYFGSLTPIGASALSTGVLYSFEAALDRTAGTYSYTLKQGSTVLVTGTAPVGSAGVPAYLTIARTSNAALSSTAECSMARVTFSGGSAVNPAHILYYAHTHSTIGRVPTAQMNDASFRAGADWYYSQGFGLCAEYDPSAETMADFVNRIQKVSGCSVTRSPVDGQYYLDVANGIYPAFTDSDILTDDDVLDFSEQPTLLDSAVNSVSVKYFDPGTKETVSTAPVQALGLIDAFGTISQVTEYPEIPTGDLALRVADRDLRAVATPSKTFSLKTTRKTNGWRPNQYKRLQLAKRGIADMVVLVGDVQRGQLKSGAISITLTQDIYGLSSTSFVDIEPGVDTRPSQTPVAITLQAAFEAPYTEVCANLSRADLAVLPADVGYLMAVAADPATSRNFTVDVSSGGDYADTAVGDWCATATVVQASSFTDTAFTLAGGVGLSAVTVGMPALWGSEIVRVDAINVTTGAVTFGRSCADTVPVKHVAGERIWFYAIGAAADITEYTDGETISVKLLTNTGSQQLPIGNATALSVTFASRAAKPYPPGKVRINGQVEPASIVGAITVTGVHRDRVQQANQLVDGEMATIGPEPGTTYTVRYYVNGVLEHTDAGLATPTSTYTPANAGIVRVELESVRDGLTSYQKHVREFTSGQPLLDESGALITTEDDQTIIMG